MIDKILTVGAVLCIAVAIFSMVYLAFGQSYKQDAKQTIDQQIGDLVKSCGILFDTGDIKSNQVFVCDNMMHQLNEECRDNYHLYCFGNEWTNYETK